MFLFTFVFPKELIPNDFSSLYLIPDDFGKYDSLKIKIKFKKIIRITIWKSFTCNILGFPEFNLNFRNK